MYLLFYSPSAFDWVGPKCCQNVTLMICWNLIFLLIIFFTFIRSEYLSNDRGRLDIWSERTCVRLTLFASLETVLLVSSTRCRTSSLRCRRDRAGRRRASTPRAQSVASLATSTLPSCSQRPGHWTQRARSRSLTTGERAEVVDGVSRSGHGWEGGGRG